MFDYVWFSSLYDVVLLIRLTQPQWLIPQWLIQGESGGRPPPLLIS